MCVIIGCKLHTHCDVVRPVTLEVSFTINGSAHSCSRCKITSNMSIPLLNLEVNTYFPHQ